MGAVSTYDPIRPGGLGERLSGVAERPALLVGCSRGARERDTGFVDGFSRKVFVWNIPRVLANPLECSNRALQYR